MRKLIIALLVMVMLCQPIILAAAEPQVSVNGETLVCDVAPRIVEGRMLLPLRAVFEALGASVQWIPENSLIVGTYKETMVVMQVGGKNMTVQNFSDGSNKKIELDVPPEIYEDRTLVPVRAISEALGATVAWDGETSTASITFEK